MNFLVFEAVRFLNNSKKPLHLWRASAITVNFSGASKRHFNDASLLQENGRTPNSGHLFGLSAECGIKALLLGLGHPPDSLGGINRTEGFREHINVLQGAFSSLQIYASGRNGGHYLAMVSSMSAFADWLIEHRYYSESAIPNSVSNWAFAALEIQYMVEKVEMDGLI